MFKTLQWLVQSLDNEKIFVGAIIAEDESRVSRHLKHCASEREIPMMVSTCFTLYNCIELMMRNHIIPSENFLCLRSAYRYISCLLAHEDSQVFAFPYTVQLSSLLLIICCCSQLAGSSRAYIQESSFLLRRKTIHLFCQQIIFQRLQFPWTGVKKYEIYFSHGLLQDECTKCSVDCHWYHLVSVLLVKCELHGLWIVTFDVFYRY